MLAEVIMAIYGWEVWSSPIDPEDDVRRRGAWRPWHVFADGFLVGTWTGPDRDLLCVMRCETAEEAERWLSPPAPTILLATLRSLALRLRSTTRASACSNTRRGNRWPRFPL